MSATYIYNGRVRFGKNPRAQEILDTLAGLRDRLARTEERLGTIDDILDEYDGIRTEFLEASQLEERDPRVLAPIRIPNQPIQMTTAWARVMQMIEAGGISLKFTQLETAHLDPEQAIDLEAFETGASGFIRSRLDALRTHLETIFPDEEFPFNRWRYLGDAFLNYLQALRVGGFIGPNPNSILGKIKLFHETKTAILEETRALQARGLDTADELVPIISFTPLAGNQESQNNLNSNIAIRIKDKTIDMHTSFVLERTFPPELSELRRSKRIAEDINDTQQPLPQAFAKLVANIWKRGLRADAIPVKFVEHMQTTVYNRIMNDMMQEVMSLAATSELFSTGAYNKLASKLQGPECGASKRILSPHDLIDYDTIKDGLKKAYNSSACAEAGSMQKSSKNSVIVFLTRTYIVEALLASMFIFDRFGYSVALERASVFSNYLARFILEDLNNHGRGFKEEILFELEKQFPEIEPLEAISKVVGQQIGFVRDRLVELLNITPQESIDEVLVREIIPTIDVQKHAGYNRFERLGEVAPFPRTNEGFEGVFARNAGAMDLPVRLERTNVQEHGIKTNLRDVQRDGGFVLETYIKVRDKEESDPKVGREMLDRSVYLKGVTSLEGFHDWLSNDAPQALKDAYRDGSETMLISDNFKDWNAGLRLVYVSPISEFKSADEALGDDNNADSKVFEALRQRVGGRRRSARHKAFFLKEEITLETATEAALARRNRNDEIVPNRVIPAQFSEDELSVHRAVYTFPLFSAELPIPDTFFSQPARTLISDDGVYRSEYYSDLLLEIKRGDMWKLVFDVFFPTKQIVDMATVYSSIVTRGASEETVAAFDTTKEVLRMLLFATSKPKKGEKWYKKSNPTVEGRGGNTGILRETLGNVSTKGPSSLFKRMSRDASVLVLKSTAEQSDPSYKFVKRLDNAGALGSRGPTLRALPLVAPINIFGPLGFGPPISPLGMAALSAPLLPGEKRKLAQMQRDENPQAIIDEEQCEDIIIINEEDE